MSVICAVLRYGDGAGNTVEENSSVVSLIRIIIIIMADNKSLQQELTNPLTSIQLHKIVKNTKEIMSHLVKCASCLQCFDLSLIHI